jgi:hypothetical protein
MRAPEETTTVSAKTPSRDDAATLSCPMCQRRFTPVGRGRYCCDYCRKKAWQRRHQPAPVPVVVPAPGVPRRPITVYECASCGARALGEQRCEGCGVFMAKVGLGGLCPECGAPVAIPDLFDEHTVSSGPPVAPSRGPAAPPKRRQR